MPKTSVVVAVTVVVVVVAIVFVYVSFAAVNAAVVVGCCRCFYCSCR